MTKILIVEVEGGLRQGLEINLRHENYDTVTAADGEEAIRLFHAESPDLVLLDLMLPKKSGFEVLDHIRKMSKVPVILLTAQAPHLVGLLAARRRLLQGRGRDRPDELPRRRN